MRDSMKLDITHGLFSMLGLGFKFLSNSFDFYSIFNRLGFHLYSSLTLLYSS